ncbi:uncharacterized protein A1O9_01115 [Exophiala aquamarina CBS 119918]|uniref:Uncharacterized protein n=1 Tax=Exophiala aquamarina CBS 119918 TaxID=1182545 RepID=A0A072PSQ5_9EURO|nr:uncharacterized protein A1O9_01115 [Exophiala aquamarina CBS 119918]KEF63139.1 hypothetical protein A1O9_01115 [Exophiala aquamarina CBS 119918]
MADFTLIPSGSGNGYTGMLTRSIVFSGTLLVFLAASGMTIASIIVPNWVAYDGNTGHGSIHYTYGLHQRCSNTNMPPTSDPYLSSSLKCVQFPRYSDCHAENRYFCSMWRSVGFLMSFAVVLEGMTIAAFAVLLVGGKQKREQGWGALTILVTLAAAVQAIGMALMACAYLFENDERFFSGWYLDKSWTMCTVSWSFQVLCAICITLAAVVLPSEGGYELIPDHA